MLEGIEKEEDRQNGISIAQGFTTALANRTLDTMRSVDCFLSTFPGFYLIGFRRSVC